MLRSCEICPRNCKVNREAGQLGYCRMPAKIYAARAALHMWEEPCISGTSGSGTVFFSGCNLRCVFCQNHDIAIGDVGMEISSERLVEIYLELQEKGAANVNLVTPTHYIPQIADSLVKAKSAGLSIPIVYNTGGYEKVESLKMLEGLIDIYLPDCKYFSSDLASAYSHAPDYFSINQAALQEMYRQVGPARFNGENGMMEHGMIIRHLCLPGQVKDSKKIIHHLYDTFGDNVYLSIMNQYTPLSHVAHIPELNRKLTEEEYERIISYCIRLGVENAFIQEGDAAQESFIPSFTYEGLKP
ncbi:MAG: radical SAM protein [Lachnospiraceae bacterium]|nr:radical SAM protein [Lachnospiraceae bacterium]